MLPCIVFSQWKYKSGNNSFDGKYKTAMVVGSGGTFPYNNPVFVINKFDKGLINIYFSNAGFSGCNDKEIYFRFNGDKRVYQTKSVGKDKNNEIWFVNTFKEIKIHEFLTKLMNHNSVDIRLKSSCSSRDYRFSLSGSTRALNFVIGKKYWDEIKRATRTKKLIEKRNQFVEDSLREVFNNRIKVQLRTPIGSLKKLKEQAELLKAYEYKREAYFYNKTDVKVYRNIYDVEHKKIITRKSLMVIDLDYKEKNYYKLVHIYNHFINYLYVEKTNLVPLYEDKTD